LSSEASRPGQVAGVQGNVPHAEFSWEEFMWGVYQVRRPPRGGPGPGARVAGRALMDRGAR